MYCRDIESIKDKLVEAIGAKSAHVFFSGADCTEEIDNGVLGPIAVRHLSKRVRGKEISLCEYRRVLTDIGPKDGEDLDCVDLASLDYSEPYEFFLTIN